MGTIHAGHIETSPRLRRVRDFLAERGSKGATTREIVHLCEVCAVNSIVAELRQNGVAVDCHDEGLNANGSRVFRYILQTKPQLELFRSA